MMRQHPTFDELVDTADVRGYRVHLRSTARGAQALPAAEPSPKVDALKVVDAKGNTVRSRPTSLDVLDSDAHHLLGQMGWKAEAA